MRPVPQKYQGRVYVASRPSFGACMRQADEREQGQKWFDAVTAQHKAEILAEREACAKVCDDLPEEQMWLDHLLFVGSRSCAEAIRART